MRPSVAAVVILAGVLLAAGAVLTSEAGPLPPAPPVKHFDPML